MYFTREGEMPTYPRLARIAVQETEDVEDAAMALIRDLRRALSDGAVTLTTFVSRHGKRWWRRFAPTLANWSRRRS
jgi:predicted ATP-grasp superfamily ATP-dependent carboligase